MVEAKRIARRVQVWLAWFSHHTIRGIARYARQAGWELDLSPSYMAFSNYDRKADGLISFFHYHSPMAGFIREQARHIPVVDMTGQATDLNAALVLPDNSAIGSMAARHFLKHGYSDLAFVTLYGIFPERERKAGFKSEVERSGKRFIDLNYPDRRKSEQNLDEQRWLRKQLIGLPKPLAVMPLSDPIALQILHICMESNIKVPEEVAIIGADNDELLCDFVPVPLSSVDSNMEEVGYQAAVLLDRLMSGEPAPSDPILIRPKGVVPRKSTDMLAVSHPALVKALRFIYDHYREPIGAADVVSASGISRRGLYKLFNQKLDRTIKSEILRLRLNHAMRLLEETRLKTAAVAVESGLSNYIHLHRLFRRRLGMSPSAFRKSRMADRRSSRS